MCCALAADAVIGNVQEKALKEYKPSNSEMVSSEHLMMHTVYFISLASCSDTVLLLDRCSLLDCIRRSVRLAGRCVLALVEGETPHLTLYPYVDRV